MVRRVGQFVAAALVLAGAATAAPWVTPASGWSRSPVRIDGADRFATAVAISQAAFPSGATTAYLVSGRGFADGLAAGPLAARGQAPVLLTEPHELPTVVADELRRLGVTSVVIAGGERAVHPAVADAVAASIGLTPARIEGATRYETAARLAATFPAGLPVAYVANGVDFADALAGGAAAGLAGGPLLLTDPATLSPETADALRRLAPTEVRVLGGDRAVAEPVLAQLQGIVPAVRRVSGPTRHATAQALATLVAREQGATAQVLVATDRSFADALAAAPLAARRRATLLLTPVWCAPSATIDAQRDLGWPDVTILGGSAAVSRNAGAGYPCTEVPSGRVVPGLQVTTELLPGPRVVHLVSLDRQRGLDLRTVTGSGRVNGLFPTSGTARKLRSPLVAVNGDFFDSAGEPTHAFASGGRLLRWPGSLRNSVVAFDPGKPSYGFFGKPEGGADLDLGGGETLGIGLVNMKAPSGDEVALVTPEWTRAFPAGTWCRAVLRPSSTPTIEPAAPERTLQPATVESASCSGDPLDRSGDVLVALPGTDEGERIAALVPGSPVTVRWKLHPLGRGVTDVVGANTSLVHGARVSSDVTGNSGAFWSRREARTAVAQRADGTILVAVVEKSSRSIGMTPRELADYLVAIGAIDAANLDGGGSSSVVVRGVLKNRPSDGTERSVNTALVIVPAGTDISTAWR